MQKAEMEVVHLCALIYYRANALCTMSGVSPEEHLLDHSAHYVYSRGLGRFKP
jgi:hypothetical protein